MNEEEVVNTVTFPLMPAELWMLWHCESGSWVLSVDDAPGAPSYLVAFGEADAIGAAKHQADLWGLECIPIRVKGGTS